MKRQKDEKWFDELISRTINTTKPKFDPEKWKQKYPEEFQMLLSRGRQASPRQPNIWRTIYKSPITKLAAAAVVIIAVFMGIHQLGASSASKAFAAAIDSVKQARTFSCKEIFGVTREDGQKSVLEQVWMFKEPDRRRHEYLAGVDHRFIGEVTITHYGKRQQLVLNPDNKTATLYDKSSDYVVDDNTGKLKLSQLNTSLRDRLLELRIGAVEDLGIVELHGQSVRMLQSREDDRITTVWIDPRSGLPVQIEIKWLGQRRTPVMYTSIQIDGELDDELFSLEPPEGYRLMRFTQDWPVNKKKMSAKIMHLLKNCAIFMAQHDGQYPKELAELERVGVTNEVLEVILAVPDQPDGPAVIQYLQPRPGADWSTEVIMYEVYDKWPEDGIVVGFADGHCEMIADQHLFEELVE